MMLSPEQLAELRVQIQCHEPVSNVLAIGTAKVKALVEQIYAQQERIAELEQQLQTANTARREAQLELQVAREERNRAGVEARRPLLERIRQLEQQAATGTDQECGACGDGCAGQQCKVEAETPSAVTTPASEYVEFEKWFRRETGMPEYIVFDDDAPLPSFALKAWNDRAAQAQAMGLGFDLLRARVADLLHLLQFLHLDAVTDSDKQQALSAMADIRTLLKAQRQCTCQRLGDYNGAHHPLCDQAGN